MIQSIISIARFLGVSPQVVSYVLTVVVTVALTIPVTVTIESATQVKKTLDEVVVNQKELERSLTSIFKSVGERMNSLEQNQEAFYNLYIRSENIQNDMIIELGDGTDLSPVHKERINSLDMSNEDFINRTTNSD